MLWLGRTPGLHLLDLQADRVELLYAHELVPGERLRLRIGTLSREVEVLSCARASAPVADAAPHYRVQCRIHDGS
ncbi:MAG: hypothetical protein GWO16_07665 [Gammaproteobacteria bacterium]|nr:hypothetical protein [Gammaproteobacteria bacterium]NIR99056.1 hypothetical protein [Gammaproteobacteria bacterium]NIX11070.1 hypothetical protein [Gammaproteobacteria bacterium]